MEICSVCMSSCGLRYGRLPYPHFTTPLSYVRTNIQHIYALEYAEGFILIYSSQHSTTQSYLSCILPCDVAHMKHIFHVLATHNGRLTHTCVVNLPRILSNKTETTDHVERQFNSTNQSFVKNQSANIKIPFGGSKNIASESVNCVCESVKFLNYFIGNSIH